MNFNTLRQFRHDIYDCFPRAKDALFNTVDALMCETQAHSFPELSQSPWFERKWPSLYEAFEDGRIDEKRLREILVHHLPKPDGSGLALMPARLHDQVPSPRQIAVRNMCIICPNARSRSRSDGSSRRSLFWLSQ